MKKHIIKSGKNILAFALSALILLQPITAEAYTFFQRSSRETVAGGIIYENSLQATSAGLINVSVLYVDVHNPYVELRPIAPTDYGTRASLSSIVLESGAMAGINADFFDMGINPTTPFGDVVVDGRIVSMDSNRPGYSTFFTNQLRQTFIEYIQPELIFLNNGERNMQVQAMNKFLRDFSAVYFDRSAIHDTAGLDARFSDLVKFVVDNNRITYIGTSTVTVPENGFIIVAAARYAQYFYESVRVGHTAEFRIEARFDYNQMQTAIGGAGKILRHGQYTNCGFVPSPNARHPRSALGITQDGSRVILAVVDGRGVSIGATHSEMATIMRNLGSYHAMHFDGGGSSTMVAETHFSDGAVLRNRPSEGTQRGIVNALGVFHTADAGPTASLLLNASTEHVFLGSSFVLNIRGVDSNDRLTSVNAEQVGFSASAPGNWTGNVFYPENHGPVRLFAEYNGLVEYVDVSVLSLAQILPTPSVINTNAGSSVTLNLRGIAIDGTSAPLRNAQFEVVPAGLGTVVNGIFTAYARDVSQGFIRVTSDGISAYIAVSIGTVTEWVTGFDHRDISLSWSGLPASVSGSVAYDDSVNNPGNFALRLNYQFGVSEATQIAYLNFDEPVALPDNLYAFEIAVHGHGRGGWIRGLIRDAAGETHVVEITENIDFVGWRNHSVRIPQGALQPVSIEQFYVVSLRNDVASGELSLFFDDLRATRIVSNDDFEVPVGNRFRNPFEATLTPGVAGQIDLTFVGNTVIYDEEARPENYVALQQNALSRFSEATSAAFFVGASDIEGVPGSRFSGNYSFREYGNYAIIEMSARNGSLAGTFAGNWAFYNAAMNSHANNIIILLDRQPHNFTSVLEYELFHEALSNLRGQGKNVFVISASGLDTSSTLIDGINYINLGSLFNAAGDINNSFRTLRIRINGSNVLFELQ